MKRTLLSTIIVLAITLTCILFIPNEASAASESDLTFGRPYGGSTYYVDSCNTSASGKIEIPSTYNGQPVTHIAASAFENCSNLTTVIIPEGITGIGGNAFKGCSNLVNITIPNSVTSIGGNAFEGCSKLATINIPESVTGIGKYAFKDCVSLTDVKIPKNVTSLGEGIFSGCSNLKSITVPFIGNKIKKSSDTYQYPLGYFFGTTSYSNSIRITQQYLGDNIYKTTSTDYFFPASLKSVTVTGGKILQGAFYNCDNLNSVTIQNGVTEIGVHAFYYCSGLTTIEIPNSVTAIQNSAFAGCSSLKSITIPFVGHATRKQSEGYQYPFGYIFGTSDFANGVATKQYYCDYSPNIHTNNTYYIPASLQSVTVTGGNILYGAFYNCSNLTSVILPANTTAIGSNAFYNCSNLTAIKIPSTVTTIDSYAFSGCGSLNQVFLPVTVNNINTGAFDNCSNLWHVLYGGSQNQWNQISVANKNTYLTQAITHHGCTGKEDLDFSTKYCSVCSANCSHNWGSGTIIKHATCKEAGSKRYTCAICNATKTEVISKTSDHTYSAWTTQNDTFHSRLCSICHSEEQATHVWDDGTITKHPSCKETGSKNHLCTVCGKSKTVILEKLADHTYDNMCDPECNVCGIMRTISHQYKTEWIMTINDHWQECSICSNKQNLGAHVPGSAATESDPQLCTVCGYIIAPVLGHTHSFATSWIADKDGHWHACASCNEKDSYSNHIWENGKCSICGLNDPNAITPSVPNTSPNTVPSTTSPLPTDSNTSISTTPNSPNAFSQSAGPVWWWIVLSVCGFCLIIGTIVIILVRKKRPS